MKQYLKTIVYLAAALVSVACSSGGDNDVLILMTLKFRGMPCQVRQRFSAFRFRRLQI